MFKAAESIYFVQPLISNLWNCQIIPKLNKPTFAFVVVVNCSRFDIILEMFGAPVYSFFPPIHQISLYFESYSNKQIAMWKLFKRLLRGLQDKSIKAGKGLTNHMQYKWCNTVGQKKNRNNSLVANLAAIRHIIHLNTFNSNHTAVVLTVFGMNNHRPEGPTDHCCRQMVWLFIGRFQTALKTKLQ